MGMGTFSNKSTAHNIPISNCDGPGETRMEKGTIIVLDPFRVKIQATPFRGAVVGLFDLLEIENFRAGQ